MTIDICMPFWGAPDDLRAAVSSVLAQDDPDWRLVVIDDCYPDDSIPAYFAALGDSRVFYVRNERNVGITENFRRAAAAARGDHVVILGSDDLLHPTYVSRMRAVADAHRDVDVIQLGVEVIDGQGVPRRSLADQVKLRLLTPRHAKTFRAEDMARSLLVGNWLYWPSLLFRTERLREIDFRDDLPIILDLALLIDIAFAGGALRYEPGIAFAYRRHDESLSQKTILDGTRFDDERAYYRATAAEAKARGWRRARRAARWRIMSRLHGLAVLPTVLRRGTSSARRAAFALAFR